MSGGIDWTVVIVAGIGAVPASVAAWAALLNRRALRTPSKRRIGELTEHTFDMSAVDVGTTQAVLAHVMGDPVEAERIVDELAVRLAARLEKVKARS